MRRLAAIPFTVLVLLTALLTARPVAVTAAPATDPTLTLLSQSPWLEGQGTYNFQLGLKAVAPSDRLEVSVYLQMRTRTGFEQAAAGNVNESYFYDTSQAVSAFHPSRSGQVQLQLPVNQVPATGNPLDTTVPIGETGVFPIRFSLLDQNGSPLGQPLVSFVTFVQQTQSAGEITPLSAAVVIPFSTAPSVGPGGTVGRPSAAEIQRLSQLSAVLDANSTVPATLEASPLTLDQLAASGLPTAVQALSNLSSSASGGNYEILPSTYAPVSMSDLTTTGLTGEIDQQLRTGSDILKATFGRAPDGRTWVVNGPLDDTTYGTLVSRGATQMILPDADLTPLANPVQITFAWPTTLSDNGQSVEAMAADAGLTQDFTRTDSPVLAANVMLAELAMIYTEAPNALSKRGVAVLPPASWVANPEFVNTLLAGLHGDPLVTATTASSLFGAIGAPQGTRYLAHPKPPPTEAFLSEYSGLIVGDRAGIDALANVYANDKTMAALAPELRKRLLLAETGRLSDDQRLSVLDVITQATARVARAATLPPATSITLTSTKSQLPITILTQGNAHPRIELVLQSQRLVFQTYSPPGGTCTVMTESTEVCTLTLVNTNTTLKVPVEARSSGVFPLDVYLYAPGSPVNSGNWLAHRKNTVRSTAVSGVALVLIGLAAVGLILWWGRDLRRGRRPKGMVPAPVGEAGATVTAGDPALDGFFNQPPPPAAQIGMSPSTVSGGPSPATERHGPGRETR
jgi:hypothetical protein